MYHVGTPPIQTPDNYTLSEVSSEEDWTLLKCHVRTVSARVETMVGQYDIFDGEDLVGSVESLADDPFYWWLSSGEPESALMSGAFQTPETLHARMVEAEHEHEWIALVSGADVSLLPHRRVAGYDIPSPNIQLEDAQGNSLKVGGVRKAQVEFEHCLSGDTGCCLSESFIVSDVTSILLSFGRMLKTGWKFGEPSGDDLELVERLGHGSCAGVMTSPDNLIKIPVYFRKNSLSALANVQQVTEEPGVAQIPVEHVRTVYVKLTFDVGKLKDGWSFMENGNPVHKYRGKSLTDPGTALSRAVCEVVGHSKELASMTSLDLDISTSACMCELIRDEQLPELFDEIELHDTPMVERGTAGGHEEQPESVWVNGKELSRGSRVRDLQDGCNYLGINASGSKAKLYDRLCAYFNKQYPEQPHTYRSMKRGQKFECKRRKLGDHLIPRRWKGMK